MLKRVGFTVLVVLLPAGCATTSEVNANVVSASNYKSVDYVWVNGTKRHTDRYGTVTESAICYEVRFPIGGAGLGPFVEVCCRRVEPTDKEYASLDQKVNWYRIDKCRAPRYEPTLNGGTP